MRLRVATYNIHKGVSRRLFGLRPSSTIHELRQRLHELDSDIVFLQEVQGRNDRLRATDGSEIDQPQDEFLALAQVGHKLESAYGKNATYLHGHHGNALLSRFSIEHREQRDVSDHALEKRGILHCRLNLGKREVHCFVVHFGLLARSRQRQTEALIAWIKRELPADAALLIGGDFNDWSHQLSKILYKELQVSEVYDDRHWAGPLQKQASSFLARKFSQIGMHKTGERIQHVGHNVRAIRTARTYPSRLPWLAMDRIYQRGFKTHSVQVLRGKTWARLSDHVPLVADLELL